MGFYGKKTAAEPKGYPKQNQVNWLGMDSAHLVQVRLCRGLLGKSFGFLLVDLADYISGWDKFYV